MDFKTLLEEYHPADKQEEKVKKQLLEDIQIYGSTLWDRSCDEIHLTASSLIVDPEFKQTLMIYHNIYQALCWTGGHADGEQDLLQVAMKEAKEETGIKILWPVRSEILSLDILPVPEHKKHGKIIHAHHHYSVAFGLIAPQKQELMIKPDENREVRWISISDIHNQCMEAHMLPVYDKILRRIDNIRDENQRLYEKTAQILPTWFIDHHRKLPWREDQNPYHVWISEIMLQQTRIEAVMGYYQRFLQTFPTVKSLAEGDEEILLKLWEGLGYYNRARNLQKTAKQIMEVYQGRFPETYEDLLKLPGIGSYTAGAIASICFEQRVPAVDGNVLRVLSRLTEDYENIDNPNKKKRISRELERVYPAEKCGLFTQGLMELGETVCIPNGRPKCGVCPLMKICIAAKAETWDRLPVRGQKKPRKHENRTVFLLKCGDHLALERRPRKGLLAGLWQFPNESGFLTAQQAVDWAEAHRTKPLPGLLQVLEKEHIFTHIHWHMRGYIIPCAKESEEFVWANESKREKAYALPTAFRQFLDSL